MPALDPENTQTLRRVALIVGTTLKPIGARATWGTVRAWRPAQARLRAAWHSRGTLGATTVRFSYYDRLSVAERRVYRRSDSISDVPVPDAARPPLERAVGALAAALEAGVRVRVQKSAQAVANVVTRSLHVAGVRIFVRSVRPKNNEGELHGLYTREEDGQSQIELWMRTAEHRRVVALRTFVRTLAHEICHHLDFVLFGLADTYHTEGFFRRESSLSRTLLAALAPASARTGKSSAPRARVRTQRQLTLFE